MDEPVMRPGRRAHNHSVWSTQAESEAEEGGEAPTHYSSTLEPTENPAAGSGYLTRTYSPRERQQAMRLEESVVCPDHLRSIDELLTTPGGKPTKLFWFSQACCAIQCPHILVGTFISPGVATAVESHDKLLGLAIFGVALGLGGTAMIIEDVRLSVRPSGPLTKLGAGTKEVPARLSAQIEQSMVKFHPERPAFKAKIVGYGLVLGVVAVLGAGIQSVAHNRVSAFLWFMFYAFGNTWIAVWIISVKMATALSGHAVRTVITTVDNMQDMTDWSTTVFAPTMNLASGTLAYLSIGWGRSVLVYSFCALACILATFSIGLSPVALEAVDNPWFPTMLRVLCAAAVLIFTALPLIVASGPAHVSTQCEELLEALNELRIAMRTQEADSEISILERCLQKLNQVRS